MIVRPVRAELFDSDRQTDRPTEGQKNMTNMIVAFSNFVNAPKNYHGYRRAPRPGIVAFPPA
jgi:hypothetical protein